MEFLTEYGLFLAKTVTLLLALLAIIGITMSTRQRNKKSDNGQIEVMNLNEKFGGMRDSLHHAMLDDDGIKAWEKAEKNRVKEEKAKRKSVEHTSSPLKKRIFVLDFSGDMNASDNESLREEITAVLSLALPTDEVVVKVESGGGMVSSYGLAASQLARVTSKNIPLTVCVDKVAASGGYMMACVANKIVAAPFAVLGSIGVVAQLPNFHKLLKKNEIDFEIFTAGEYKRTVTMLGEITEKGRSKFAEDLEDIHVLFKEFVSEHRPQLDIAKVATGETWFGRRAKEVNLVDEIQTSDEYLFTQADIADIYQVEFTRKKSLLQKIGFTAQMSVDRLMLTWWERLQNSRRF